MWITGTFTATILAGRRWFLPFAQSLYELPLFLVEPPRDAQIHPLLHVFANLLKTPPLGRITGRYQIQPVGAGIKRIAQGFRPLRS